MDNHGYYSLYNYKKCVINVRSMRSLIVKIATTNILIEGAKNMKRIVLTFIIFCITGSLNATVNDDLFEQDFADYLVKNNVPKQFQDTLLKYSHDAKSTIYLIAIGFVESEWKYMVSFQPNKNGSVDKGPLGLNSNNIQSSKFRQKFYPKDQLQNHNNVTYMIASINYFRFLIDRYNYDNALLCYNGGIGNFSRGTVPDSSLKYLQKVNQRIQNLIQEKAAFIDQKEKLRQEKKFIPKILRSPAELTVIRSNMINYLYKKLSFFKKEDQKLVVVPRSIKLLTKRLGRWKRVA